MGTGWPSRCPPSACGSDEPPSLPVVTLQGRGGMAGWQQASGGFAPWFQLKRAELLSLRGPLHPQPEEAQPLSQLDLTRSIQHLDSSALWRLIGCFPILHYPSIRSVCCKSISELMYQLSRQGDLRSYVPQTKIALSRLRRLRALTVGLNRVT